MENLPSTLSQGPSLYSSIPATSQMDPSFPEGGVAFDPPATGEAGQVPRPKRIACVVCRRRKLRCDGKRPSCGTCSRLGHECAYDEVRKKSGPKRGYVKQLEARLAQVETLLKGHEPEPAQRTSPPQPLDPNFTGALQDDSIPAFPDLPTLGPNLGGAITPPSNELGTAPPNEAFLQTSSIPTDPQWDLIELGLEEPLPAQDVIDELERIYFQKVHPMMPIIHPPRYYASLILGLNMRPPICLRYMIWCHAASVTDKYFFLHNHFYQRARKYAEQDEMKGFGESIINLSHCQMWILVGTYEFRMIYFPRAWLSVGKSVRLALMMGLHRLDGVGLDVKQSILPPKDWTEREERRRVFWMAFCADRYASIGTGWPMIVDENDIMTNLPATEEAFLKSKPQRTLRLANIVSGEGISTLSPFACVAVLGNLFGRNLVHIHRPQPHDNDYDLNGDFWKRHRSHDNILLNIALSLPDHLRLPNGMDDVNVIFASMSIHTSTICLHQAAIFKAEKNKMPSQIVAESKRRCLVAANQISSIMKMISHVDLTLLNPFMSFCLYIASRVFIQYLKSRPSDSTVYSSLQFLLSALNAMKSKAPLTESFLVQLDVDLEGTGIRAIDPSDSNVAYVSRAMQANCPDSLECSSLYTFRQTQADNDNEGPQPENPNHGGPSQQTYPDITTSLPTRHRESMPIFADSAPPGDNAQHFFPHATQAMSSRVASTNPGAVVDMDMDFSPEFGVGEKNPPSDHPTPSTLNSSSNTSYSISGVDNPSPGRKQPKPGSTQFSQGSTMSFERPSKPESSSGTSFGSATKQTYMGSTDSPLGTTAAPNAFPPSSGWEAPTPTSALGNMEFNNLAVDSLTEAQWAQILNNNANAGWENWRQP
ncbi:hypothetical protein N7492_001246 [Penicillium capsulatum]|uniref:Zn(2)-C6 fungal-type domain-containing protein n=1 Tax=Penicillium capsulatum TaxID=69766 RepID=A0A9W9IV69_9EURO|nr:hypothetical protein N7492_001246 [Penicillium capsulatum]KAJ6129696.1 hypothetical protein N7512_002476 [Penicillium capsulatum]